MLETAGHDYRWTPKQALGFAITASLAGWITVISGCWLLASLFFQAN